MLSQAGVPGGTGSNPQLQQNDVPDVPSSAKATMQNLIQASHHNSSVLEIAERAPSDRLGSTIGYIAEVLGDNHGSS